MASDEYLTIFNDAVFERNAGEGPTFHQFPLLPRELRDKVWTYFLRRTRLIFLECQRTAAPGSILGDGWEAPADYYERADGTSGVTHYIRSRCLRSCPLLRVSHEAREASLAHYRVRLRCQLIKDAPDDPRHHAYRKPAPDLEPRDAMLMLNPEWDILHLAGHYVDLLHDVRESDPKKIGLRSMAWGHYQFQNFIRLPRYHPRAMESLGKLVAGLEDIYWILISSSDETPCAIGRMELGIRAGGGPSHLERWYNLSAPLRAENHDVKNIGPDPRLTKMDMHRIWVGGQPRQVARDWDQFKEVLGVENNANCGFMVNFLDTGMKQSDWDTKNWDVETPCDRKGADEYLKYETERWVKLNKPDTHGRSSWLNEFSRRGIAVDKEMQADDFVNRGMWRNTWGFWVLKNNFWAADERGLGDNTSTNLLGVENLEDVVPELWVTDLDS